MLKLTRVAAVLLIGLAVILAIVAFGTIRRAAPAPPAIPAPANAPPQPATCPLADPAAAFPARPPIPSRQLPLPRPAPTSPSP